jgi:hypothetical protein
MDNINPKCATTIDNKVTIREKDKLPGAFYVLETLKREHQ